MALAACPHCGRATVCGSASSGAAMANRHCWPPKRPRSVLSIALTACRRACSSPPLSQGHASASGSIMPTMTWGV
jgi:hypothetical protein